MQKIDNRPACCQDLERREARLTSGPCVRLVQKYLRATDMISKANAAADDDLQVQDVPCRVQVVVQLPVCNGIFQIRRELVLERQQQVIQFQEHCGCSR